MIAKWSARLTGAVFLGMMALAITKLPGPKMASYDPISSALWGGCKLQALNRISSLWK
jgi:hypothetical protein